MIQDWKSVCSSVQRVPLKVDTKEVMTVRPQKATKGVQFIHFIALNHELLRRIQTLAKGATSNSPIFLINPLTEFAQLSVKYLGDISGKDVNTKMKFSLMEQTTHMNQSEWIDSAKKVLAMIEEYINLRRGTQGRVAFPFIGTTDIRQMTGNFFTFPLTDKASLEKYLGTWTQEYVVDSQAYFNEQLGMKKLGEASYTPSDLEFLDAKEAKEAAALPAAKDLSCGVFTLLKSRAPVVKELLKNPAELSKTRQLSWWQDHGYQLVDEPIGGDFALYLHPEGNILHVGFCLPNGKILSKPGDMHPYIYAHAVFDLLGVYQWNVVFLRFPKAEGAEPPADSNKQPTASVQPK